MIEFHTDPMTGKAMYRYISDDVIKQLTENDTEIISGVLNRSETFYPEQFKAVNKEYERSSLNKRRYDFLRARRIINCCFGENDRQPDYDTNGNHHFEMVKCPIMAECRNYRIICQPEYQSNL